MKEDLITDERIMKKYKVTFEDVFEAHTEEGAYDEVIKYCYDVGFTADVTAFNFEEIKEDE